MEDGKDWRAVLWQHNSDLQVQGGEVRENGREHYTGNSEQPLALEFSVRVGDNRVQACARLYRGLSQHQDRLGKNRVGKATGVRKNRLGATERLVQFIMETNDDTLSRAAVDAAKIGILDGVANMLAGAAQPLAEIISTYVQQLDGTPVCSIVGQGFRTNAPSAAFANGIFLHCLDFEIQGPSSYPRHLGHSTPQRWPWEKCPALRAQSSSRPILSDGRCKLVSAVLRPVPICRASILQGSLAPWAPPLPAFLATYRPGYRPPSRAYFIGKVIADSRLQSYALWTIVHGDLVKARDLAKQGWEIARDVKFWYGVGWGQRVLGRIAQASGAFEEAESHLQEALQTLASNGEVIVHISPKPQHQCVVAFLMQLLGLFVRLTDTSGPGRSISFYRAHRFLVPGKSGVATEAPDVLQALAQIADRSHGSASRNPVDTISSPIEKYSCTRSPSICGVIIPVVLSRLTRQPGRNNGNIHWQAVKTF